MTIHRMFSVEPKKFEPMRVTYQDQTHTVVEWAKIKGLSYQVLRARILHKWPIEIAMETPLHQYKRLGKLRLK